LTSNTNTLQNEITVKKEPLNVNIDFLPEESATLFMCSSCNGSFDSHMSLRNHQSSCSNLEKELDSATPSSSISQNPPDVTLVSQINPLLNIVSELRKAKSGDLFSASHSAKNVCLSAVESQVDIPSMQSSSADGDEIKQTPESTQEEGKLPGVHECANCHMTFADAEYLTRHLVRCKDHQFSTIRCDICNRGFTTKGSLELHVDSVHLKKKEFGCSICGRLFSRKHILKTHIATHYGKRDFQCAVCGKKFLQKSNLSRHERIHEAKNFGYGCRFCGQAFTQNKHLNNHMLSVHSAKTSNL